MRTTIQEFTTECENQRTIDLINGLFTLLSFDERAKIKNLPINERAEATLTAMDAAKIDDSKLATSIELLLTLAIRNIFTGHIRSHFFLASTILWFYMDGDVGAITSLLMFIAMKTSIDKAMTPLKTLYMQNVNFYGHSTRGYVSAAANTMYDFIPTRLIFRILEGKSPIPNEDKETIKLMAPSFRN